MLDKIKRAIGWNQDSKPQSSSRPSSPSPSKKELGRKASRSIRNSLPARFRHSIYRNESSSSETLPIPPPKDIINGGTTETDKVQPSINTKPSQASIIKSVDPLPINTPQNNTTTSPSSPRGIFIKRTSSFQSQKASSESNNVPDEDIIIFTSTPPVSIAPSSSMRSSRVAPHRSSSICKGSPDQTALTSPLNQESHVVQWPRGPTSSAANRSQEHFLRSHRRTSTGSNSSIKDLQANIATTPPQRPSLDRQFSRSSVIGEQSNLGLGIVHSKNSSDSTENTLIEPSPVVKSGSVALASLSNENQSRLINNDVERLKTPPSDILPPPLPPLNPNVVKQLYLGIQMLKISAKKQHSRLFRLDLENGKILWDSRKFGKINVEQIKELRRGKAAKMYREQLRVKPEHEDRWLTIIYSAQGKYKALHLVAPTQDTYQDWIMAVERMWSVKREVGVEGLPQLQRKTNQWLREHWLDADKDDNSKLGYEEIVQLCHRLNINFSRKEIRVKFNMADEKKQGNLDFSDFTHFVKLLKERKEVTDLFGDITTNDSMSSDEFINFMVYAQKSKLAEDQIIEIYGKHIDKSLDKFTVDSLTSFLLSADNNIVSAKHSQVHQDMTQTLSNYYISSSHNTYLLGHQLTGISSIEGYIRALQSGCRCVELDCWDGPDGQPVIYHGRTLTSKILFRDVIEAISTYAFVNSPYPLILSLELHCDLDQQEIMASIMKTKLGSWLVVAPLDSEGANLPSPDDLKFKILIKSKVLPPDVSATEYITDTESESEKESESDSDNAKNQLPKTKSKKARIARALSDITVYCKSRHFPGYIHDECQPYKIISFSERVSLRHASKNLQEYINMNKSHLTRVYPAGFRINSTNYDPHNHWAAGCQVVALNYQNFDRGMHMNAAMFSMNGHCGYVLKPAPLRLAPGEICNHENAPKFAKSHPVDVTIKVISAQQLPRPGDTQSGEVVDPVCEVELNVPGEVAVKYRTRHVTDNGFNPVWQEEFTFRVDYEHHELVFIRFSVLDEDIKFSDMIASYCISLDCMEEGYRHIQLHDSAGDPYLYSTLFVKVSIEPVRAKEIKPPVADELVDVSNESQTSIESTVDEPDVSGTKMAQDTKARRNLEISCDRPLPELPEIVSPALPKLPHEVLSESQAAPPTIMPK